MPGAFFHVRALHSPKMKNLKNRIFKTSRNETKGFQQIKNDAKKAITK